MTKDQFAYAKEHNDNIPNDIVERYNLRDLANSRGYVLIEIHRGMYGLPIAGKIAHVALVAHLEPYGYSPCQLTPSLWTHKSRPIISTL